MTFLLVLRLGQVRVSIVGGVAMLVVLVGGGACQREPTPASPAAAADNTAKAAPAGPPMQPHTEGTERRADASGEAQALEPKLEAKTGLATIQPGQNAEGASVSLVSGAERRPLPRLPITVQIPIDNDYSVVAGKPGFADFEEALDFPAGQTERTFVIDLVPVGESANTEPPRARDPARPEASAGL